MSTSARRSERTSAERNRPAPSPTRSLDPDGCSDRPRTPTRRRPRSSPAGDGADAPTGPRRQPPRTARDPTVRDAAPRAARTTGAPTAPGSFHHPAHHRVLEQAAPPRPDGSSSPARHPAWRSNGQHADLASVPVSPASPASRTRPTGQRPRTRSRAQKEARKFNRSNAYPRTVPGEKTTSRGCSSQRFANSVTGPSPTRR